MLSLFRKWADAVARTSDETAALGARREVYPLAALLGISLIALTGGMGFTLIQRAWLLTHMRPSHEIALTDVHVVYGPATSYQRHATSARRSDANHFARVAERKGKDYWLSFELPSATVAAASHDGARDLVLGWINSSYELWIDDTLWAAENGADRQLPLIVTLPQGRLAEARPIEVAIHVTYDSQYVFPDFLRSEGIGLATPDESARVVRGYSFQGETRPLLIAGVMFICALFFGFFWISAPRRQEYWYLAFFALVQSALQMRHLDFVQYALPRALVYGSEQVATAYEGAFALMLGLAYARVRLSILRPTLWASLLTPVMIVAITRDSSAQVASIQGMLRFFVPFLAGVGAFACAIQALTIWSRSHSRAYRLVWFAFGLVTLGALYAVKSSSMPSAYVFRDPFVHLTIVLGLSLTVLLQYREQEKIVEKTHLSKYLKRMPIPTSVAGWGFELDLKGSTSIRRERGDEAYSEATSYWFSAVAKIVTHLGGEILAEGGDSITAFFDGESDRCAREQASEALAKILNEQALITRWLGLSDRLEVRGALAPGEISPVWKQVGSERRPGYSGALFIELSRLIELERKLPLTDESRVMIEAAHLKNEIPYLKTSESGATLIDKDGRTREVYTLSRALYQQPRGSVQAAA